MSSGSYIIIIINHENIYLFLLLDQLKQVTARAVFEDDPEMVSRLIPVEELQDMSVLQVVKDTHL